MNQLDLQYPNEGRTGAQHPYTSFAAAAKVDVKGQRKAVRDLIADLGHRGATDEEMQIALGWNGNTQRPRRRELVQLGLVKDSGMKRNTRMGNKSTVWVVT